MRGTAVMFHAHIVSNKRKNLKVSPKGEGFRHIGETINFSNDSDLNFYEGQSTRGLSTKEET
jgi:hypothetical protein